MNEPSTPEPQIPLLDEEDRERLRLWAQATPAQRLAWLEEAMQLAANARTSAEIFKKRESDRL
jgi:hypothetical protein